MEIKQAQAKIKGKLDMFNGLFSKDWLLPLYKQSIVTNDWLW